ncbi:hypothetical protein B9Q01_08255 [Candidatus Marsarchaeota G1 archaeon OSP_D]|uniref:Dihydrodipicolinate synthase family protein n=2 Tax=Candidatus Marsarchaeota group 1 TaxID=2203770 RepID=A0A2R6A7J7_9ARCH|nr:MAG: hypothetical protein B9Q01_08255 [Candidatus Marsarchaeota G1 archaeon OSP_D]
MAIKTPGLIVPPLTPFNQLLKVDYSLLQKEIDYIIAECKPEAITVAGVETQEYQYLSHSERIELINKTVEYVGDRCKTVIGVSHPSIEKVVELSTLAEKLGAEAVQVIAPLRPYGGIPTKNELVNYFKRITEKVRLPIVLYHNPGPGAELSLDTMIDIAKLEGVDYIKESSRDMRRIGIMIQEIEKEGYARYFTTMEVLLPTLLLGGAGGTMPPPAAVIGRKIIDHFKQNNVKMAVEYQQKFYVFPGMWIKHGLAPLMKLAMKYMGLDLGDPYPPFQPIPENDVTEIKNALKKIGVSI